MACPLQPARLPLPAAQPSSAHSRSLLQAKGSHRGSKQASAVQADVAATARALGLNVCEEHAVAGFSGAQEAAACLAYVGRMHLAS